MTHTEAEAQATDAQKVNLIATEVMGWHVGFPGHGPLEEWRDTVGNLMAYKRQWNPLESEEDCAAVRDALALRFQDLFNTEVYKTGSGELGWLCSCVDFSPPGLESLIGYSPGVTSESYRRAVVECAHAVAVGVQAARGREGTQNADR